MHISLLQLRMQSLIFLLGLPPSFFASHSFAFRRSCVRALPSLNLKKKRDYLQSNLKWSPSAKQVTIFCKLLSNVIPSLKEQILK